MKFADFPLEAWHCKNCVFYDDRDSTCKRNPPVKVSLDNCFPFVDKHDFCGEWRYRLNGERIEFF